jgi:hypothetical protein
MQASIKWRPKSGTDWSPWRGVNLNVLVLGACLVPGGTRKSRSEGVGGRGALIELTGNVVSSII